MGVNFLDNKPYISLKVLQTGSKIEKILEKDRVLGRLAVEAEKCFQEEKYFAALSCLFVLAEHSIKQLGLDKIEGNFHNCIEKAKREKVITYGEAEILHDLRNLRNKLFHESHYAYTVLIDGISHPLDEVETKKILYKFYSDKCYSIILNII